MIHEILVTPWYVLMIGSSPENPRDAMVCLHDGANFSLADILRERKGSKISM
jgi:hypothetical protein